MSILAQSSKKYSIKQNKTDNSKHTSYSSKKLQVHVTKFQFHNLNMARTQQNPEFLCI